MSSQCNILAAVAQHALERPDATALEGAFTKLSYAALQAEATELATSLSESAPDALGLWMANTPARVVADLAAMQAWIPLIPMPLNFSPEQTEHLIINSGVELVMTDQPGLLRRMLETIGICISDADVLDLADIRVHLLQLEHPAVCVIPESVARVSYGAETPDAHNGVCLSLHAMEMVATSMLGACDYSPEDRHLCTLPLTSLAENIGGVYAMLLAGGVCVLAGLAGVGLAGSDSLNATHFLNELRQRRITACMLTPQMLTPLITAIESGGVCPACLRHIAVIGGSAPLPTMANAVQLGLPAYAGYARAEASGIVTMNTPQANRPGSVGQPLPHVTLNLADNSAILVRGSLFSGYIGREDMALSASFWVSGDFGYPDEDGFLYLTDHNARLDLYPCSIYG